MRQTQPKERLMAHRSSHLRCWQGPLQNCWPLHVCWAAAWSAAQLPAASAGFRWIAVGRVPCVWLTVACWACPQLLPPHPPLRLRCRSQSRSPPLHPLQLHGQSHGYFYLPSPLDLPWHVSPHATPHKNSFGKGFHRGKGFAIAAALFCCLAQLTLQQILDGYLRRQAGGLRMDRLPVTATAAMGANACACGSMW